MKEINLVYHVGKEDANWEVVTPIPIGFELRGMTVPLGFLSDGASVPRLFWVFFPPTGKYLRACIIHDYLLSIGAIRKTARKIFSQELKADEVHPVTWFCFVNAVRLFDFFFTNG